MNDRKEAFQPVVFDESVVLENLVNEEVNAHSVIEQDRELDEISRKLDMIHDRMGTFEAPIHHQFNQTSQISVLPKSCQIWFQVCRFALRKWIMKILSSPSQHQSKNLLLSRIFYTFLWYFLQFD